MDEIGEDGIGSDRGELRRPIDIIEKSSGTDSVEQAVDDIKTFTNTASFLFKKLKLNLLDADIPNLYHRFDQYIREDLFVNLRILLLFFYFLQVFNMDFLVLLAQLFILWVSYYWQYPRVDNLFYLFENFLCHLLVYVKTLGPS